MSNRYSTFPDALDQLKLLSEVQEMTGIQKQKVARYSELALKTSFTGAEEVEFQALYQDLKGFQLNSSDWNKVVETLMNTQRYIKETVMGDVGVLIDNAELNIGNTVIAAKGEINTLKANTFVELAQKVSQIVSDGVVGIDFFKGRSIASSEVSSITISVPQYNRSSDFLMVHINGALVSEGINYTIGTDGYSIKVIGGTWVTGTVFDFIVLKKTIVLLETYDVGLFEDGSIRKEKLTVNLQNEITNSTNNKQNKSDVNLVTNDKTIVGSINETNTSLKQTSSKLTEVEKDIFKIGDLKTTRNPQEGWLEPNGRSLPIVGYEKIFEILKLKRGVTFSAQTSSYPMTGKGTVTGTHINYKDGVHYFMTYAPNYWDGYYDYVFNAYYTLNGKDWQVVSTQAPRVYEYKKPGVMECTSSYLFYQYESFYNSISQTEYNVATSLVNYFFDTTTKTVKSTTITVPAKGYQFPSAVKYYNDYGGITLLLSSVYNSGTSSWNSVYLGTVISNGTVITPSSASDAMYYVYNGIASTITPTREGVVYATSSNVIMAVFSSTTYTKRSLPLPIAGKIPTKLTCINQNIFAISEGFLYICKSGTSVWSKVDLEHVGLVFTDIEPLDFVVGDYITGYDSALGWFVSKVSDLINWNSITDSMVKELCSYKTPISYNQTYMVLSDGSYIRNPTNTSTRTTAVVSEATTFTLPKMDVPAYTYMKVRQ